jgi:hypothetical protein
VAEYFLAILTVQSPLRHSVTFWQGACLAVTNNAKTQRYENVSYWTLGLHAAIMFDRFYALMAKDGFTEVQQKLQTIALKLKNENDPDCRRTLLKEMSGLLAEAQRISSQPPKP